MREGIEIRTSPSLDVDHKTERKAAKAATFSVYKDFKMTLKKFWLLALFFSLANCGKDQQSASNVAVKIKGYQTPSYHIYLTGNEVILIECPEGSTDKKSGCSSEISGATKESLKFREEYMPELISRFGLKEGTLVRPTEVNKVKKEIEDLKAELAEMTADIETSPFGSDEEVFKKQSDHINKEITQLSSKLIPQENEEAGLFFELLEESYLKPDKDESISIARKDAQHLIAPFLSYRIKREKQEKERQEAQAKLEAEEEEKKYQKLMDFKLDRSYFYGKSFQESWSLYSENIQATLGYDVFGRRVYPTFSGTRRIEFDFRYGGNVKVTTDWYHEPKAGVEEFQIDDIDFKAADKAPDRRWIIYASSRGKKIELEFVTDYLGQLILDKASANLFHYKKGKPPYIFEEQKDKQ